MIKLAAILLPVALAGAPEAPKPEQPVEVLEIAPGESAAVGCVDPAGCVAMSKAKLQEMLQRAAKYGRSTCGTSI